MVERPVGIVQTAGRILTEVVFDRTHGRLNSPASGSGSPVPRSRDLVSRATGLWPQAWPPVAGSHRGFAAAVSSFASNQEMQVCKVGIDGCALAPLASARVEDGIENVRSATAHKPTKDCRDPHTRVMVRAGFSFQVNAQIPSDVMRGQRTGGSQGWQCAREEWGDGSGEMNEGRGPAYRIYASPNGLRVRITLPNTVAFTTPGPLDGKWASLPLGCSARRLR